MAMYIRDVHANAAGGSLPEAQRVGGPLPKAHGYSGDAYAGRAASLTAILFFIAVLQVSIPPVMNAVFGSGGFRLVAAAVNTPQAALASDILRAVLIATAVFCVVWSIIRRRRPSKPILLVAALSPFTYIFLRSLYVSTETAGAFVVMMSVMLATWALRPDLRVVRFIAHVVGALALLSLLAGIAWPSLGIFVDQSGESISLDKWSPFGSLLRGVFSHPNTLGQTLAIGLWSILSIRSRWLAFIYLVACVIALIWSGSRTALLVSLALAVVAVALRLMRRPELRAILIIALTAALSITVAVIPSVNRDPSAFSFRGQIWLGSLQAWRESPIFGLGGDWYFYIAGFSNQLIAAAFHGHNAYVHYLATGGIVLVTLAAIFFLVVTVRSSALSLKGHLWPALMLMSTVALCSQEVPLNFASLTATGPFTWFVFGLILFCDRFAKDGATSPNGAGTKYV